MIGKMYIFLFILLTLRTRNVSNQDMTRRVGRLQEVFAWTQLTYNIDGTLVLRDRFGGDNSESDVPDDNERVRRQTDGVFFNNEDKAQDGTLREQSSSQNPLEPLDERYQRPWQQNNFNEPNMNQWPNMNQRPNSNQRPSMTHRPATSQRPSMTHRPTTSQRPRPGRPATPTTSTTSPNADNADPNAFFIQYNNVPMGVERYQNRLFVTVPRRRYGIPSTLNYLDLNQDSRSRSPSLRPYPDLEQSRQLVSVYRTRVDECNRLWMVDTGRLEIPNQHQQVQSPAIVVFDLATDRQLFRYEFKSSDLPRDNTPAGLASITVDIQDGRCDDAYAYVPDLVSFGLLVYSLRENDSWRLSHNYFSFNPAAGNLNIGGQRFQWNDGIFSLTLSNTNGQNCKNAYFHPLVSTHEFLMSTCDLRNRNFANESNAWERYTLLGDRGANSQSTMHGYHAGSHVLFYADVGRNAVSCWQTRDPLIPSNVVVLAEDSQMLLYPSDLHVTGDEVWVMANSMPRFIYSTLDTTEYNFHIYRGNVSDLVAGTICEPPRSMG